MRLAGGGATHRDKQGGRIEFPEAGLVGSGSVSIEGRRRWTYRSLPVAYGQNCSQQEKYMEQDQATSRTRDGSSDVLLETGVILTRRP
jgi:hypothetical protein